MLNCKNFDELEKFLLNNYGIRVSQKFKALHFASVIKGVDGVLKAIDTFPQLLHRITLFDTHYNNAGFMFAAYDGTIFWNLNKFGKIMPMKEKNYNKFVNGKWSHPVNSGFASLGAHEAGHVLCAIDAERRYPNKSVNFTLQVYNNSSVAKDILNDVAKANKAKLYNLQKEMCRYAQTNASECIAECIADYITNGDKAQRLSVMVAEYFKSVG